MRARGANRDRGRDARRLTFFHRVDSPHSYLLAQALEPFLEAHPFELEIVVVPAPAAGFDPEPRLRARHDLRDARAIAPLYGLSFPTTDELPHEARVRMANAVLLKERPPTEQLALALQLSAALFAHDGDKLHRLSDEHGGTSGQEVRPRLEAAYQRLRSEGHYRDASLSFEGEWYVGVDRLFHLEERVRVEDGEEGPPRFRGPDVPRPVQAVGRAPIEAFFSFRSPYSYVALARLSELAGTHPIDVVARPVLPLAMSGIEVPPEEIRYATADAAREAGRHGIPFGRVRDPASETVERCLAIAFAASHEGRTLEVALSAMRAIWSEAADLRDDAALFEVAERAGLARATARAALSDRRYLGWVEGHVESFGDLELWDVPSFRVGERTFFGQDRIPLVIGEALRVAGGLAGGTSALRA
jgi:2-hydroxychromene-2-carboxylate isomerase